MKRVNVAAAGFALGMCALIIPATVAAAGTEEEPFIVQGTVQYYPVIRVGYADLNLGRTEGVERLNKRVERAAGLLCIDNSVKPLKLEMMARACKRDTIADVAPQVAEAIASFGRSQLASNMTIEVARR